jgi:hypothetical protein
VMLPALPPRREAREDASENQRRVGEIVKPAAAPTPTAAHPFLKNATVPVAQGTRHAEPRDPQVTSPVPAQTPATTHAVEVTTNPTPTVQPEPGVKDEDPTLAVVVPLAEAMPLLFE